MQDVIPEGLCCFFEARLDFWLFQAANDGFTTFDFVAQLDVDLGIPALTPTKPEAAREVR